MAPPIGPFIFDHQITLPFNRQAKSGWNLSLVGCGQNAFEPRDGLRTQNFT